MESFTTFITVFMSCANRVRREMTEQLRNLQHPPHQRREKNFFHDRFYLKYLYKLDKTLYFLFLIEILHLSYDLSFIYKLPCN